MLAHWFFLFFDGPTFLAPTVAPFQDIPINALPISLFVGNILASLLSIILLALYLGHLITNNRITELRKMGWLAAFLAGC